ncbi:hypothetical protein DQK91_22730 [Oceanidesulfovibrio marinus]|uniref:Uncharacterized protein n=2 Tax=Oceanidesulfovibrio marinus TaxID=370038 RepID=A0A6P1ZDP0_9BACT|nr:hypothetical protein DQK91_22730 [Oceanidesulfovibrio marinus]
MSDESACKQCLHEVNWAMVHTDAVTMYLEWGTNNWCDSLRPTVTGSDDDSIYFVVDTWEEPNVVLIIMTKYGSTTLYEHKLPYNLSAQYVHAIGGLNGMHALTPSIITVLEEDLYV